MTAIILGGSYVTTKGRKPSRPSFLFDFHNDASGGTAIVDRFGNAANLALQGTLGTSWTASRGWWRPNGTDQHAITGSANEYAGQTVMADGVLNVGQALMLAIRYGYAGTKPTSNEALVSIGRSTSTSPVLALGTSAGALANVQMRGVNASALSTASFGSSADYSTTADMGLLWHIEATATGIKVHCWKDGVAIGTEQTLLWTANAGTKPTRSNFAMPDALTIAALRGGSSGSPTWTQRIGASNAAGTRIANVLGVNLAEANIATAGDVALEIQRYPRFVGEILGGL